MIDINLTLFVELTLFLLFMWVTHLIILKPALSVMDERDDKIEHDAEAAEKHLDEANTLEQRYADEMSAVRREASAELEKARHDGLVARAAAIRDRKRAGYEEIAAVEAAVAEAVDAERKNYDALVRQLASEMSERLRMGGAS
jgi:F-type H+-transporting ATPase subunit b